jgi:4-amino-4-deoxy-L-arabinose transferase-like glycosyltransferase
MTNLPERNLSARPQGNGQARFMLGLAGLLLIRLVVATWTPLAFDEAYYWLWSKHLAGGYYDHPPMVAILIRLGTMVAGDTELGVRLASVLLAIPTTWAVFEAARIFWGDVRHAWRAALLFNLTLLVTAAGTLATPDTGLLAGTAFALFFLAKLCQTGRGPWWLGVGAACGMALLSNYIALFLGAVIVVWLLVTPGMRRWFLNPWPYLGGLLVLALFWPVFSWNAAHDFASFRYQLSGRLLSHETTLRYPLEMMLGQIGLATPFILFLGAAGLIALHRRGRTDPGASLTLCMIWVPLVALAIHSLQERVNGNWLLLVYPALSLAAAVGAEASGQSGLWGRWIAICRRCAVPVAAVIILAATIDCVFAPLRLPGDPIATKLAYGWPALGKEIDGIIAQTGAVGLLTADYHTTAWLAFYLPRKAEIVQVTERIRWVNAPPPSPNLMTGPLLYFPGNMDIKVLDRFYGRVTLIATLLRGDRASPFAVYPIYLLQEPKADPQTLLTLYPYPNWD